MKHSQSRILRETKNLLENPPIGTYATVKNDNYRYFDVTIYGPENTPYYLGVFKLELFLPEEYPLKPPKCIFKTKIYHPNIDKLGRICLDILKTHDSNDPNLGWAPGFTIEKVLLAIRQLLFEPSIDDPLDTAIADHFRINPVEAKNVAHEWTLKYANS